MHSVPVQSHQLLQTTNKLWCSCSRPLRCVSDVASSALIVERDVNVASVTESRSTDGHLSSLRKPCHLPQAAWRWHPGDIMPRWGIMWGRNGHETGTELPFRRSHWLSQALHEDGGETGKLPIREKACAFGAAPLFELRIRGYAANLTIIRWYDGWNRNDELYWL